jgi:hypothetical protein
VDFRANKNLGRSVCDADLGAVPWPSRDRRADEGVDAILRAFGDELTLDGGLLGPRPLRIGGVGPRLAIVHCPESSSLGQLRIENEPIQRDPSRNVMPYNFRQGKNVAACTLRSRYGPDR